MGEDAQNPKCPKCGNGMACKGYSYWDDRLRWRCLTCGYEKETYPNDKSQNDIIKEQVPGDTPPNRLKGE